MLMWVGAHPLPTPNTVRVLTKSVPKLGRFFIAVYAIIKV